MGKFQALLAVSIIAGASQVSAMQLDSSFSGDGIASFDLGGVDFITALDIQADGKIVVGGFADDFPTTTIGLVRYNTNGTPDSGFGSSGFGVVIGNLTDDYDELQSIQIQNDGSILVGFVGREPGGMSLNRRNIIARYTSGGVLDDNFADQGLLVVPGSDYILGEMVLLDDGSILVCGNRFESGNRAYIAKYDSEGVPDDNFGTNGIFSIDLVSDNEVFQDIFVRSDGSLLLAGITTDASQAIVLVKLTAAGDLDSSLDGDGIWNYSSLTNQYFIGGLTEQEDGDIVVVATHSITEESLLLMIHPDGELFEEIETDNLRDLLLLPNGKIMATGQTPAGLAYFQVYNEDGSLERTFGSGGTQTISSLPGSRGEKLLRQDDGKIVMGGAIVPSFLTMRFDDPDPDEDGVMDTDNCPDQANPNQLDNDGDDLGNVCDSSPNPEKDPPASGGGGGGGSTDLYWCLFLLLIHRYSRYPRR